MEILSRRRALHSIGGMGLSVAHCAALSGATEKNAQKPNVLFIMIDDLRPELGCYGNRIASTPNIDSLASRGVIFQRAYCQEAICVASRGSIMTGLRPELREKEFYFYSPVSEAIPEIPTMPSLFRENGYRTVSLGKVYHYSHDDPEGWDHRWDAVSKHESICGVRDYLSEENLKLERTSIGKPYESADVDEWQYRDGKIANYANEKLSDLKAAKEPFFLAVGFRKPHLPFNAPETYWDLFNAKDFSPKDVEQGGSRVPPFAFCGFPELRKYAGIPENEAVDTSTSRTLTHGYYACVAYVDHLVGTILERLRELRLTRSTVICLLGDHGYKLGEHGEWTKGTNFEVDTRSTLMLSGPGISKGSSGTFVEFIDLYPTLCDLCGLSFPRHLHGKSFGNVLRSPEADHKHAAFSQFPRAYGTGHVIGYSVRTNDFRYTEWLRRSSRKTIGRELYDHRGDGSETENLVGRSKYRRFEEQGIALLEENWPGLRSRPEKTDFQDPGEIPLRIRKLLDRGKCSPEQRKEIWKAYRVGGQRAAWKRAKEVCSPQQYRLLKRQ